MLRRAAELNAVRPRAFWDQLRNPLKRIGYIFLLLLGVTARAING